jgi:hypothetical protein
VAGQWGSAERCLSEEKSLLGNAVLEAAILRRVCDVQPAGNHGDGPAMAQRPEMGGGIDPAGEAGRDGDPGSGQGLRHAFRDPPAAGRGVAGADHGHLAGGEKGGVAERREDGGRVLQRGE